MSTDCETIMDGLSTNISMLVRGVVSIIVSIIFLFVISWELTVTLVGSIIPLLIFAIFYGKRVKKLGKIITDKHQGSLFAKSNADKGSTFTVLLPLDQNNK